MKRSSRSSVKWTPLLLALAVCAAGSSVLAQSGSLFDDSSLVTFSLQDPSEEQPDEAAETEEEATEEEAPPRRSSGRSRNRRRSDSQTRAPAMMGDFFGGGIPFSLLTSPSVSGPSEIVGFLPIGSRRSKIADNGKALATDRVFLNYHHYSNALSFTAQGQSDPFDPPITTAGAVAVDQYTFGVEKTFLDGLWSAELRMPFTSDLSFTTAPNPMDPITVDGGEVGNLTLNLKRSVYRTETTSVVIGLGMTFPTGSDTVVTEPRTRFVIRDESVHLMPFVGCMRTPSDKFYYQFFAQADIAAYGNPVFVDLFGPVLELNEANLLYLDFQAGYWLYQDDSRRYFPGVAAMLELHETAILSAGESPASVFFPSPSLHSLLTLTAALNLEVTEMTNLRVGGVFPLTQDNDAFFDGEFMVQLNRHF